MDFPLWVIVGGLVAGAVAALSLASRPRLVLPLVGLIMFIASLGLRIDKMTERPILTWLAPLQTYRSQLYVALGALLFFALPRLVGGGSLRIPAQALVLFLIGAYNALMRLLHGDANQAALSLGIAVFAVLSFMLVVPLTLRDNDDAMKLERFVGYAGLAMLFATAVQIGLDQSALMAGPRFTGFTANPQFAAIVSASVCTNLVWLSMYDDRKWRKIMWLGGGAAFGVIVLWTGSRTGLGMAVLGLGCVLYRRLGNMILLLPVGALIAYPIFVFLSPDEDIELATSRLFEGGDTRTLSWQAMLETGMENPLIGVGVEDAGASENSFLLAFAGYGIGMVMLTMALAAVSAWVVLQAWRVRKRVWPEDRPLVDLIIAHNAMYLGSSMFEGIMLTRVGPSPVFILISACLSTYLLDRAKQYREAEEWGPEHHDEWEYDEHYDEYAEYGGYGEHRQQ